jgi:hypothetical protein
MNYTTAAYRKNKEQQQQSKKGQGCVVTNRPSFNQNLRLRQ